LHIFFYLSHPKTLFFLVARFAQEVVKPKVLEMDENEKLDADILKALFEQGVSVLH
jgi:hypothetical protein